jgi:twinkle protein
MKKAFYVLKDFENNLKTNTRGKNYVAKCPECEKWNLYISKKNGLYNCFTGGCEFKGILQDFCEQKPVVHGSSSSGTFYPKRGKLRFSAERPSADSSVRMIPTDYKRLKPEIIAAIKPITEATETEDLDEMAAWHYLSEMGISRKTAALAHVGCLTHHFPNPDSKEENAAARRVPNALRAQLAEIKAGLCKK